MAKLTRPPARGKFPSFTGRMQVYASRGVLRVAKWPRKRGKPTHPTTLWWNDWFRQANFLAKYADAMSHARAIEMTTGTPLYPRDVLLAAMRGRLYSWVDETGWRWFPVAAQGDVSESLDVLAQTIGSVLVRAVDRWRSPPAGDVDDVLTYKGALTPPVWQAPGGGGFDQVAVPGTPVTPDNTKNLYDFDVTAFANVAFMLDNIGFAASDRPRFLYSVDGGVTFKAGATDYTQFYIDSASSLLNKTGSMNCSSITNVNKFWCTATFGSLRVGRPTYSMMGGRLDQTNSSIKTLSNFDGPVTHIRLKSASGNNFNAGTIRASGF